MHESSRLRVIYIAGISHTGSTLLGHMLGELEGTFYGGEIRNTWQRGVLENRACTCGATFANCSFWHAVIARLPFSAEEKAEDLSRLHRQATRLRERRPRADSLLRRPGTREAVVFAKATEALYCAVADVARVHQIIDSSKSPRYAAFLGRLPSIDLRVVHLVRDPRATAYSFLRRSDLGYKEVFTRSLRWVSWNVEAERLARLEIPYARIRYEDLVENPIASLDCITKAFELRSDELPIEGRSVTLSSKHIFSGNRARGEVGRVALRNDSEWRRELPEGMQRVVRATTLPLLRRYGYSDRE
jgi:Sulfotransferase family